MIFDLKYPSLANYAEPEPNLLKRSTGYGDGTEPCGFCKRNTNFFDIDTQQFACSDECLAALRKADEDLSNTELDNEDGRLTTGRPAPLWMDEQAAKEYRDLLDPVVGSMWKEDPRIAEILYNETKTMLPGDALVHVFQKLGGQIPGI